MELQRYELKTFIACHEDGGLVKYDEIQDIIIKAGESDSWRKNADNERNKVIELETKLESAVDWISSLTGKKKEYIAEQITKTPIEE